jgi:hypothetical protein
VRGGSLAVGDECVDDRLTCVWCGVLGRVQRKKLLKELEDRLATTEAKAEQYEAKSLQAAKTVSLLLQVPHLLNACGLLCVARHAMGHLKEGAEACEVDERVWCHVVDGRVWCDVVDGRV